jgi:RimJ/RimL family protein N-acetyltransferase
MLSQPTLETARLILRPFDAADAPLVQTLAGAREIADTTLAIPHPYPDSAAVAWIATHYPRWEARTGVTYAITSRDAGTLIGAIDLNVVKAHALAELGYWIGLPYWNRGYCTEAAHVVVAFGFDSLALNRIQARHLTRNPQSGRVMQKIGMRHEGVRRDAIRKWGRFEDVALYGILAAERTVSSGER